MPYRLFQGNLNPKDLEFNLKLRDMKCIIEFDKPKIIHEVGETTCRPFRGAKN